MKTLADIRNTKNVTKAIDGIKVVFTPSSKGVVVMIDGDILDTYSNMSLATKSATEFIKQYKGMK